MIDRKTTISNLETNIRWIEDTPYHQFPGWGNVTMSMRDAVELLKEQEPVRPTWLQGKAYCSSCGLGLPRKRAGMGINYCSHCGQGVKWE